MYLGWFHPRNNHLSSIFQLQKENLQLHRQLHGLTPGGSQLASEDHRCPGCQSLSRQKIYQNDYYGQKMMKLRAELEQYERHCRMMQTEMQSLIKIITDIDVKYQVYK